jgi:hypothetical protein
VGNEFSIYYAAMTDSEDPKDKQSILSKLNAMKGLILAIAALVTAVGSYLKPEDQTATKNTYEWSAQQIEELSAQDVQLRQDIVAIRNYLEGYIEAQKNSPTPRGEGVGLGSPPPRPRARRGRSGAATVDDLLSSALAGEAAMDQVEIEMPEPLPEIKAMPKQMDAPDFNEIYAE